MPKRFDKFNTHHDELIDIYTMPGIVRFEIHGPHGAIFLDFDPEDAGRIGRALETASKPERA